SYPAVRSSTGHLAEKLRPSARALIVRNHNVIVTTSHKLLIVAPFLLCALQTLWRSRKVTSPERN
ncbi:MAG TPA: hypothetical protein VKA67_03395, partial [Verrucomicrobiae bacterium]|nr:hypothetical protein [Verrucomicrobiae bacterium]